MICVWGGMFGQVIDPTPPWLLPEARPLVCLRRLKSSAGSVPASYQVSRGPTTDIVVISGPDFLGRCYVGVSCIACVFWYMYTHTHTLFTAMDRPSDRLIDR